IIGRDLVKLRIALVGIISCWHYPIFWVLRHSDQFIVGMSGARGEDRYGTHASREQEIAHRYPPCDSAAGDRRKSTRSATGRHPFDGKTSGSVSQRNGGVGGTLTFNAYAPPSLRGYVRIPGADVLEAGSRKKIYSPH